MLQLPERDLSPETAVFLQELQDEVNKCADFNSRSEKAKSLFDRRTNNKPFKEIRATLKEMSFGIERCSYCEDSKGNAIEHILPKNYFPESCFIWENYCLACTDCNSTKLDKYPIWLTDSEQVYLIPSKSTIPPPVGLNLFINPRLDDPLQFIFLDINQETFFLLPFAEDGTLAFLKGFHTIDLLQLNDARHVQARQNAYYNYKGRLKDYLSEPDSAIQQKMMASLRKEHHKTVWHEMKRQKDYIAELKDLFVKLPEALTW